jgi:hypothetical protein
LVAIDLVAWLQYKRKPRYNLIMKRKMADENPGFDCRARARARTKARVEILRRKRQMFLTL